VGNTCGVPFGTGFHADASSPDGLDPAGFNPSRGHRSRSFANVLDDLISRETEDQRWVRNAAQWLRDNPDTSQEENTL
jgi:hypothetical protein